MTKVSIALDILGRPLDGNHKILKKTGRLETKLLKYDINTSSINKPIFIGGLARAGSTIILEFVNSFKDVCSYHYGDYPFVHANYFWNFIKSPIPLNKQKIERAHQDTIAVNAQSPEALDEILWMSFFKDLHNPDTSNILKASTSNEAFEDFYKNSLLKLLFLRKSKRLALKNNYYGTRLQYMSKLFPDGLFLIPFRSPKDQIFSLLKQHKLLKTLQDENPRGLRYMQRHGHFEFGNDIRPVNYGNQQEAQHLSQCLQHNDMLEYYTRMWAQNYDYLLDTINNDKTLKSQCHFIDYDELCETPKETLNAIADICDINDTTLIEQWSKKIKKPDYYSVNLSTEEINRIKELTDSTYQRLKR